MQRGWRKRLCLAAAAVLIPATISADFVREAHQEQNIKARKGNSLFVKICVCLAGFVSFLSAMTKCMKRLQWEGNTDIFEALS